MHQTSKAMEAHLAPKKGGVKRRKTVKRSSSKRGGYYGFSGALGTGAPSWGTGSEMSGEVTGRGGNAQMGGKKKRKGSKKTRKVKRGGGSFAQAVSGFTGVGTARGLGGYQDVSAPTGKAAGGEFNNFGAQPGSGFKSFITTSK